MRTGETARKATPLLLGAALVLALGAGAAPAGATRETPADGGATAPATGSVSWSATGAVTATGKVDPGPESPPAPVGAPAFRTDPAASPSGTPTSTVPAARAAVAFDSLKKLAGTWIGKSTKGWEEEVTLKAIAGGSVLVVSSFDAHPGEEMLTTYYMDGGELQLRHFCIARNQPRLAATDISPDGREITFTFKDATNLPSRDKGHMDKVVYRLAGEDAFSSQWTWYQDGKESWMEEIRYQRVR